MKLRKVTVEALSIIQAGDCENMGRMEPMGAFRGMLTSASSGLLQFLVSFKQLSTCYGTEDRRTVIT